LAALLAAPRARRPVPAAFFVAGAFVVFARLLEVRLGLVAI
jgi:hypothetical protein